MAGQKIRIRLKAYDHEAIDASARKIVETVTRTGASGPHLDRDDFPPRASVRKGDTPDRGDRWTTDR